MEKKTNGKIETESDDSLKSRTSSIFGKPRTPLELIAMAASGEEGESLLKSITSMVEDDQERDDPLGAMFAAMDEEGKFYLGISLIRDIYEGRAACSTNDDEDTNGINRFS